MLTLRPYQEQAKAALYQHLRSRDTNPCIVLPTAAGKTPLLASVCRDAVEQWQGRVLILAHVKELLQQAADKLRIVCPEVRFGVYSAGLGRRDIGQPVIVAGIQSVYHRACELDAFDLILVDEAHLIPPEGDGMYRQFLGDAKVVNPHVRVAGFTATPFRLKSGPICTSEGILNDVCFEVGVRELIRDGYLCPLVSKAGRTKVDTGGIHVRGSEFIAGELEQLMDQDNLVESACAEIVEFTRDRRACLIFASGVQHGSHLVRVLKEQHGLECGFVTGETPSNQRDEVLARFREGGLKYLANVNVLTTGFDAPNIDCVVLLRPTLSPGLFYQMCGRGFRLHPDKQNCLVLDFGGNILRHGPVDQLAITPSARRGGGEAPAKECPECHALIAAGFATCPECGYQFPPPERQKHEAKASEAGILSGQVTTTWYTVQDVHYSVHQKRGAADDAPKTMRVEYRVGWHDYKSEWICLEHTGYARTKAEAWWTARSADEVPDSVQAAVDIANNGGLAVPTSIEVRRIAGDPYERIVRYELGPIPEGLASTEGTGTDIDGIPF